jgi:hypothetical protein
VTEQDQKFTDPKGASERLHQSPRTLANWRSQGRGPKYHKIGGKVLYDLSAIESFITSCERNPQAPQ